MDSFWNENIPLSNIDNVDSSIALAMDRLQYATFRGSSKKSNVMSVMVAERSLVVTKGG